MIAVIVGEGGSGGAVAIAAANRVLMFEHAVYSVISPEGCASILWRTADKAADAAEAMKITAQDLQSLGVVDRIVAEPLGGAHRDPQAAIGNLKAAILEELTGCFALGGDELLKQRRAKYLGRSAEQEPPQSSLVQIASGQLRARSETRERLCVKRSFCSAPPRWWRLPCSRRRRAPGAASIRVMCRNRSRTIPSCIEEFGGAETGPRASYVDSVGRRVAAYSGVAAGAYRFTVLNSAVENAFATPGRLHLHHAPADGADGQ